jgi:potassium large conductance calcium-activated channel subfamily M alpha protein 1
MTWNLSYLLNSTHRQCSNEALVYFPISYACLYSVALLLSAAAFSAGRLGKRNSSFGKKINRTVYYLHRLKQTARKVHSGNSLPSQLFVSFAFLCNVVYMIIAVVRTYRSKTRCFRSIADHKDLLVELWVTLVLCVFFIVRLLASDHVVRFWAKLHTIVDVATLPNVFLFLCLGQDWPVTKTLRILWLTQLADVLRFLPLCKSKGANESMRIILRLLALWLGAAGLIHLLETTGDPWKDYANRQNHTYLEYVYFTIVTLSTVGYGDIAAVTDAGRAFMTFFIVAGIAYFAFFLPGLVNTVMDHYQHTQWKKFYLARVTRHVLVCGPLTAGTVSDFLKQFLLHQRLENQKTHVLLMHTEPPDQKLRTVLRSHYSSVQYLLGSPLNAEDLERAKLSECLEVFILARKQCVSPEREDEENLLRLLSIKTAARRVPVTIQVLLSSSKAKVKDIPYTEKDTVVCFAELKLGLLARNCVCPGLSTVVCNLFHTTKEAYGDEPWRKLYCQGVLQKIYCSHFSTAFHGLSFYAVAEKCYERLGLILIAVKDRQLQKMYITPSSAHHGLLVRAPRSQDHVMLGYFIGKSQADVDRVSAYIDNSRDVGDQILPLVSSVGVPRPARFLLRRKSSIKEDIMMVQERVECDRDDVLHIQPREMEQCIAGPHQNNHILVCIIADETSPPLNLSNFLEPIRRKAPQLLPVTIAAQKSYLEKEWKHVSRFPSVSVVIGNPLEWVTLSRASVERCRTCVILTALKGDTSTEKVSTNDNGAILCSLMVKNHLLSPPPIVTVLEDDFNAKFLALGNQGWEEITHVHLTKPFACGELLAPSFVDSVTVSSFYSPGSIFVADEIISGQTSKRCPTKSRIHKKPLSEIEIVPSPHGVLLFRDVYMVLLRENKTAVAVSRLLPQEGNTGSQHRFTVNAPSAATELLPTDHILFLCDSGK